MAERVFTLANADIELFYIDSAGVVINPASYVQACAEGIRLIYRFEEIMRRPTGQPYPIARHINEEHLVEIDSLWMLDGSEYAMERNREMMLRITWTDPNDDTATATHIRTYRGVTDISADVNSDGVLEHKQSKRFRAKYYVAENSDA